MMLVVPDELDLLAFFECEPIHRTPEEGYYCYKVTDSHGIELYFSFHAVEGSVQVRLMLSDRELVVVSEECAEKIKIENDKFGEYLECTFNLGNSESKAIVQVRPEIKVRWFTLRT